MPWCEGCSRYWVHTTVNPDGSCPECGRIIAKPSEVDGHTPWHFKLLVFALVVYLGFRFLQGAVWLVHRL